MASNAYVESLISSVKRVKITPGRIRSTSSRAVHSQADTIAAASLSCQQKTISATQRRQASSATPAVTQQNKEIANVRLPKAVQAVFLAPLKRAPTHGIPVCDLQIRSYSVRNLEAFADFCLRAAYYLNLPAKGPVPLPRITERWTVPRSNFIFKKSQENFERITMRRLIQIQDGHPETVALWLAYIQKQRYYGVGLKANVYEHGKLEVTEDLDAEGKRIHAALGEEWDLFNVPTRPMEDAEFKAQSGQLLEKLIDEPFKAQWGAYSGMAGLKEKTFGRQRFVRQRRIAPPVAKKTGTAPTEKSDAAKAEESSEA